MIKYILRCKNIHEFESWFSDSNEFDKLKKKNFISCIICGSQDIEKSIMSPRIINNSNNKNQLEEKKYSRIKKDLSKLRQFIETNFENVGDKFHSRVRSIYYDKKKNKNIYGTTTEKERKELEEEGIAISTVPWVEKEN
jgi:hypothetical protein